MVGRKLTEDELSRGFESGHNLSNEIYHESSEQFNESTKSNEGLFMYYMRHSYVVFAMLLGVGVSAKAYFFSFET